MKNVPNVEVASTSEGLSRWVSSSYVSQSLKEQLERANVLLIPVSGVANEDEPLFPEITPALLDWLQKQTARGIVAEVAVDDEFYHELVLHGQLLDLGRAAVKKAVVPVVLSVIAAFLYDHLKSDAHDTTVRFELIVDHDGGPNSSVRYDGPALSFEKVMTEKVLLGATSSAKADMSSRESTGDGEVASDSDD